MKNKPLCKISLIACVAIFSTLTQVNAVNMAGASGTLSEVAVNVVEAKANLAAAAGSGDVAAASEAAKRSANVDDAMNKANQAYADLQKAVDANDVDAAAAAAADLAAAKQSSTDALMGKGAEASAEGQAAVAKKSDDSNKEYAVPNIRQNPWATDTAKGIGDEMFNLHNQASGSGESGKNFEADITEI